MELSAVADELYGLPLNEFTATRDERAAEARKAGETELAKSLKQMRKPSTGAWIANLLVRAQPREVERLIKLGETLRSDPDLEGARIRRATKEKAEAVDKLLQHARSIAARAGLLLSQSVEQELEATLDAAFADSSSAESLREARLTTALHYSGLGFGSGATARGSTVQSQRPAGTKGGPQTAKAKLELERAQSDAERAASEAERAQRAVTSAQADLDRLRAALTVATRKATRADEKASAAQKKLDKLGRKRSGG